MFFKYKSLQHDPGNKSLFLYRFWFETTFKQLYKSIQNYVRSCQTKLGKGTRISDKVAPKKARPALAMRPFVCQGVQANQAGVTGMNALRANSTELIGIDGG